MLRRALPLRCATIITDASALYVRPAVKAAARGYMSWWHGCVDVDPCGTTPLLAAVKHKHQGCVKIILKSVASTISWQNNKGQSALHLAAMNNDADMAKLLLEHGADPGQKDTRGQTPVDYAVARQFWHFAGVLLGISNPDALIDGVPLVVAAAKRDHEVRLRVLCELGAKVNATDVQGNTALHVTSDYACVSLLLNAFAATSCKNRAGLTPVDAAIEQRRWRCAAALMGVREHELVPSATNFLSLVKKAGETNHRSLLRVVCELRLAAPQGTGSRQCAIDNDAQAALFVAVTMSDSANMIRALYPFVNVDAYDRDGYTAFQIAAANGNQVAQNTLRQLGADTFVDDSGMPPLLSAVKHRLADRARLIVTHAPNTVSQKNKAGQCALHLAAMNNDVEMAKLLLEHGANPAEVDTHGKTPLDYAVARQHWQFAALLLGIDNPNALIDGVPLVITATKQKSELRLRVLCELGANVNATDTAGNTALHVASDYNFVTRLLNGGAVTWCQNYAEATPLDVAITQKRWHCAAALMGFTVEELAPSNPDFLKSVKKAVETNHRSLLRVVCELRMAAPQGTGCRQHAIDNDAQAALFVAVTMSDSANMIRALHPFVNVDAYDRDGKTAIDVATQLGYPHTAALLRELPPRQRPTVPRP